MTSLQTKLLITFLFLLTMSSSSFFTAQAFVLNHHHRILSTTISSTFYSSHAVSKYMPLTKNVRLMSTTTSQSPPEHSITTPATTALDPATLSSLQHPFLKTMRDRGYLYQCTSLQPLDQTMTSSLSTPQKPFAAYLGFDATAPSLHVGSLLQIMILRHLQKSGCKPIVLMGGATSKIGDPTGKDESRKMLTDDVVQDNIDSITKVFEKFLHIKPSDSDSDSAEDTSPANAAEIVNNEQWLSKLNYLSFLRTYGPLLTINRMLNYDSIKLRLTRPAPLSLLEFNYMILQSYDFMHLSKEMNVELQIGGSDQWGNILSGVELTRKSLQKTVYGLTAPLITTSNGVKMGKTEGGAVWLDKTMCSEWEYWQFWRNTLDEDVERFLMLFTELDLDYIKRIARGGEGEEVDINKAKIVLADEATKLLHGEECLAEIHATSKLMFSSSSSSFAGDSSSLPKTTVAETAVLANEYKLIEMLVELKLSTSKAEAKRLIGQGGCKVNERAVTDVGYLLCFEDFVGEGKEVVVKAGKKRGGVGVLV